MIYAVSLAEFGAVTLQTLQKMKMILKVCPQAECLRLGVPNCLTRAAANLLPTSDCGMYCLVKTVDFNEVKRQEANSRMAAARKARRSPQAAAALQQRASLVGNGAKWRITNFKQVARAMAKWA